MRSREKIAQQTATSGTAMTAPRRPAIRVPEVTDRAMTTGCNRTWRPMMNGWKMCPSSCPIRAMPAPTSAADSNPLAASATTIAMTIARGAPISGMNAPMMTSTASGAASGTPRSSSRMNASTPSVRAMRTVPRVYPENVYQPAPAASFHVGRDAAPAAG